MDVSEIIIDDDFDTVSEPMTVLNTVENDTLDSSVTTVDQSFNNQSVEEIDVSDDDVTTIDDDEDDVEVIGCTTISKKKFVAATQSKCNNCRQANKQFYSPPEGVGAADLLSDENVNIVLEMDDDDGDEGEEPLQYKITQFSIYCREERDTHMVPVFAENLLITGKKIFMSGKVVRLDGEEEDEGLRVKDIGPITMWSNATGTDNDVENIIISAEHGTREIEFNLMKPCAEYKTIFQDVYRMVYLSNKIITQLKECAEDGNYEYEYEDLLSHIRGLDRPTFDGEKLPFCDDEFFHHHSNFFASQIQSYDNEDLIISNLPASRILISLSGGRNKESKASQSRGKKNTPQPTTHNTKSQTTPLVAELFESTFQQQMKTNRAAKSKLCTCKNCQKNNCGNCDRCAEMISFGGKKEDSKVLCLERQCLKALDQEVVLDDDEEVLNKRRRQAKVVKWGESIKESKGKTYYEDVVLRMGPKERKVKAGSYLLITPDEEEHQSIPHYPCRVLYLYTRVFQGRKLELAHVQWFVRGENTILGRTGDIREWYLVKDCEEVLLTKVSRVLEIEHVPVQDITRWRKTGGTRAAIMKDEAGGKDGFWRQKYTPEFGRFEFPSVEEVKVRGPGECYQCDRRKEEMEAETEVQLGKRGRSIKIKGSWYEVGQFMLVTDTTIKYKIPAKLSKTYPKQSVDPKLYPEHWRKPDVYEGDYSDVWEPFQVVRLEQVISDGGDILIRVRKLYRPHDTHLSHEEARTKPLTELFWSEEICRMYTRETAARTNMVSMDDVVGPCYVRPVENTEEEEDVVKWTDEGEDRFFISKSYNADYKKFRRIDQEMMAMMNAGLEKHPATLLDEVTPLNTLDIFAGCGGLSLGLGQAGVADHKWAIEFWKPSADAYKKNNPRCKVFNEECNGLLKKAMDGQGESENIPKKGDVDLLVGGPPCQGFSILNNFKDREYSKFKNSLIATYLSYCDFYRPKFFILENVRNLVQNEQGMVLKLILATLVKMGYQVGFQVLQAGHYGVAQTRRRLIILAAAPGEVLPLYPEPLHVFAGPHYLEVEVDGRKYSPTNQRPGAARRALTVWDAISDLPEIESGHHDLVSQYPQPPLTHLQKMFRLRTNNTVEDHISKSVNSINQERISRIPTTPGSDWRDLPNITTVCEDGRWAKKLNYPYDKADGSKGVCSCNVGTERRRNYCDQDDRQMDTLIPWSVPHTADRHNNWKEVFGRAPWDGYFKTTITDPEPLGKQGQVLHPEQNR